MNIHGKRVFLRAVELSDAPLLNKWSNDPEIWNGLGGWHFPFNSISTDKWIQSINCNSLSGNTWAIESPDLGLIGTANIVDIDWKNRHALHGMMLGDKDVRGKGYGIDTVMAIMRYAFDNLGLERLDGDMIEYNIASLKLYINKCGWKEEGRQRRWHYRSGAFWDRIVVGVTRQDYQELVEKTNYWA